MSLGSQTNRIGITSRGGAAVHRRRRRRSAVIILSIIALAMAWVFWASDNARPADHSLALDTPPADAPPTASASQTQAQTQTQAPPQAQSPSQPRNQVPPPAPAPALPTLAPRATDIPTPQLRPTLPSAAAAGTPAPAPRTPLTPAPSAAETAAAADITQAIQQAVTALPAPKPFTLTGEAKAMYNRADRLIADGHVIEARNVLSQVLFADNAELSTTDANAIRSRLADLNQTLIFSSEFFDDDPICKPYEVDTLLSRIGVRHRVPWQLLEVINDIKAQRVQAGQTIKVLQGPLHARVIKHQFVMDVFAQTPSGQPVFVHTFPVGLGKNDKTPVGNWKVTAGKKVANPNWRDEENGEFFESNNPLNPIGEYWIPIEGTEAKTKRKKGFGIHGTIDPTSIGREASRGCIRLGDADIELVYYLLTDHSDSSTLTIKP